MVHLFNTEIPQESINNVNKCLQEGYLSQGDWVDNFEDRLKYDWDFKNFMTVNNGTAALHLALKLANIKPNDEVILPAQTFVATGMAVLYCGAYPVFADIDKNGCINLDSIQEKVTSRTKAIIMVHWGGLPCDINRINAFCKDKGIKTIEDAAQSFGAKYKNVFIGNHDSDFVCFSFQATKHLTTGDGGGLICKSKEKHQQAEQLRWFGIDRFNNRSDNTGERLYNLNTIGYKYHMNNIAAAIGMGQLPTLKNKIQYNQAIAEYYNKLLDKKIETSYSCESSYWFYPIMVNERNTLIRTLYEQGYESSVVHQGIDRNKIFGGINKQLKQQRIFEDHFLALPIKVNSIQLEQIHEFIKNHESKYGVFEWMT